MVEIIDSYLNSERKYTSDRMLNKIWEIKNANEQTTVLVNYSNYSPADFEGDEKPKGEPLEIEFFLLRGVNERGWRGSGAN